MNGKGADTVQKAAALLMGLGLLLTGLRGRLEKGGNAA